MSTFKRVVILDSVIFYPEHRTILSSIADEVLEFPSSLPAQLEQQYDEQPELFRDKKCYTQIPTDNVPVQLLMNRCEGADVIISCWTDIPDEILKLNPQLKLIIFWTHEKEHRINMNLADELGIVVQNIPDYGTDAVTEVVFAGLYTLLMRNLPKPPVDIRADELGTAVIHHTFERFRMLQDNEKYTRSGKFTHHFHKLGKIHFDFDAQSIADYIPERLIADKRIGLLNVPYAEEVMSILNVFQVQSETCIFADEHAATYYRFLAENELIFYDANALPEDEIQRIEYLFPHKCIDIHSLPYSSYSSANKVFGIIGLGRIGSEVAKKAAALGFRVVYFSDTRNENAEYSFGVSYCELNELLRTSDVVSLHVPAYTADGLLAAEKIALMRPGTVFINTADGNALDQYALTQRMLRNEIFAYLDVYPGLPRKDILGLPMQDPTDWKLKKTLPNHVLAYRAGWKTRESIRVKTYKLLGEMMSFLEQNADK